MELIDIMNKYNYNDSLKKYLKELYDYILETKNGALNVQFLKCLDRVEIILTSDIGKEISERYDITLATQFFLSRAKGQYWIMPEILKGEIKRKVFVKVNDSNNLTDEECENLLHELIHLLRSYGIGEILYDKNKLKIVSGVKKSWVSIVDNEIDMNNLDVENESLEERFVVFLSKYFDFLYLSPYYIDQMIILLAEELDLEKQEEQEKLELFLNMLIIKYFYDGDIAKCLLPSHANFIEEAKKKYDISIIQKFITIYQNKNNNKQELADLLFLLDTKMLMKGK